MKSIARTYFIMLLAIILFDSCNKKTDIITPEQLIGSWKTIIGENEYISFELVDSEYVYSAFTYDRLATTGTWELGDNVLTLKFDYDGSTASLDVKLINDTLLLNNGEEKYIRINTIITGSDAEKSILDQIQSNFTYGFKPQESVEFTWNYLNDNKEVIAKPLLFEVISYPHIFKIPDFSELNESETAIVEYLASKGFIPDSLNISDLNSSFIKGNEVVIFTISSNPEPAVGDTAYINVLYSILE